MRFQKLHLQLCWFIFDSSFCWNKMIAVSDTFWMVFFTYHLTNQKSINKSLYRCVSFSHCSKLNFRRQRTNVWSILTPQWHWIHTYSNRLNLFSTIEISQNECVSFRMLLSPSNHLKEIVEKRVRFNRNNPFVVIRNMFGSLHSFIQYFINIYFQIVSNIIFLHFSFAVWQFNFG